jgi:DNA-binding beta-propeller fold protein YncE
VLAVPLAAIAALMLAVALILTTRAVDFGGSPALASTAARPDVIGTLGTRVAGPFPVPHIRNLTVLPNGRIAVSTYGDVNDTPQPRGVAELSPSGHLLWSWAFNTMIWAGQNGLAADASGNIYLAARYFKQIYKLSPDGVILARWATGLRGVTRIAVDSQGNVWILDFDNSRLVKLSPSGKRLASYGSVGVRLGQFINPDGLAIGRNGNLYVADWGMNRVTEYSPDGTPLRAWGGTGIHPGQLRDPRGLAIDSGGNVYVADTDNARIQKFSADGRLLAVWGRRGAGPGEFIYPAGVSVAPDGKVYVADDGYSRYCACGVDRIKIFSPSGTFLSQVSDSVLRHPMLSNVAGLAISARGNVYATDDGTDRIVGFGPNHAPVAGWGAATTSRAQLATPAGIAVATNGDILAVDYDSSRVDLFAPDGTFIRHWGSVGAAAGDFGYPQGIAVNAADQVLVMDTFNGRVQEFTVGGKFLRSWNVILPNNLPFRNKVLRGAISVDRAGNVYVGNEASMTVDRFSPTGRYLTSLGGDTGSLQSISGLAVDARGRVYVADSVGRAVTVYSPSGALITRWATSRFPALGIPRAIALDHAGNIYVGGGHRIVELAPLA